MATSRRVRYAVVGLGHIAQAAVLPAFEHASNAELVAIVSDDPRKQRELARRDAVVHVFDYEGYDDCLGLVDSVYIALPSSMHADYTIRAANAGVHVPCEKPLAHTAADCRRMIAARDRAGVKLMTAYRLHFDTISSDRSFSTSRTASCATAHPNPAHRAARHPQAQVAEAARAHGRSDAAT